MFTHPAFQPTVGAPPPQTPIRRARRSNPSCDSVAALHRSLLCPRQRIHLPPPPPQVALRRRRTQDCTRALLPRVPRISHPHHCLLHLGPTTTITAMRPLARAAMAAGPHPHSDDDAMELAGATALRAEREARAARGAGAQEGGLRGARGAREARAARGAQGGVARGARGARGRENASRRVAILAQFSECWHHCWYYQRVCTRHRLIGPRVYS